ncbi:MAG: hypothetical protein AB4050_18095 [Synechococcus sp.]
MGKPIAAGHLVSHNIKLDFPLNPSPVLAYAGASESVDLTQVGYFQTWL